MKYCAGSKVPGAVEALRQDVGNFLQADVAGEMSSLVIELLKMVDIERDDRQRAAACVLR